MIYGIGIDLIEIERVARQIAEPGFKKKMFAPAEIEYCENNHTTLQSFAARFAAKEAFFKALGTGWIGRFSFTEVEILNDESGKPEINVLGAVKNWVESQGCDRIHLTLTHLESVAGAVVIIEKNDFLPHSSQ